MSFTLFGYNKHACRLNHYAANNTRPDDERIKFQWKFLEIFKYEERKENNHNESSKKFDLDLVFE